MFFFFFKQKTAYEIGTGDWSSDVCSSDLNLRRLLNTGYRIWLLPMATTQSKNNMPELLQNGQSFPYHNYRPYPPDETALPSAVTVSK